MPMYSEEYYQRMEKALGRPLTYEERHGGVIGGSTQSQEYTDRQSQAFAAAGLDPVTGLPPQQTLPANSTYPQGYVEKTRQDRYSKMWRDRAKAGDSEAQIRAFIAANLDRDVNEFMAAEWSGMDPSLQAQWVEKDQTGNPAVPGTPEFDVEKNRQIAQEQYGDKSAYAKELKARMQPGMNAQDRANMLETQQAYDQQSRGQQEALRQQMMARGAYGGGAGIAQGAVIAQQSAQNRALNSLKAQAAAESRAEKAREEDIARRKALTDAETAANTKRSELAATRLGTPK